MSKKSERKAAQRQAEHDEAREETLANLDRQLAHAKATPNARLGGGHGWHPEASEAEETATRRAHGLPS